MENSKIICSWGMIPLWCLISLVSFAQRIALSAAPPRLETDFNKNWKFIQGDPVNAQALAFNDVQWRSLSLPHDWSIEGEFSATHPAGNSGGALPGGTGWYRKTFKLPAGTQQKIYIEFGGIYRNSTVWINGHLLGTRPNGYISFRYELSNYLLRGNKSNVIAVRVDNSAQPNSRWYSGSGIYRNVRLVITGPVAVAHWGTFITADSFSGTRAVVHQATSISNKSGRLRKVDIEFLLLDPQGRKAGFSRLHKVLGDTITRVNTALSVAHPILWSPATPRLYTLITRIYEGRQLLDQYETLTGIRFYSFSAASGLVFNGKPLKILGLCMHHDLGALGAAVNTRAMERQLELLKQMGCNAIRFSHNPPAAEMLNLCDRMGFMVMDEAFDMWQKKKNKYDYSLSFDRWHQQDLEDMIKRDRNHPSVILWSIGNEIREQFDTSGTGLTRELVKTVKSLDPTRPVTSALTETVYERNFIARAGVLDVLGFNYKSDDYDKLPLQFRNQKFIASETTSALETRGVYQHSDTLRYWPADGKHQYETHGNADWTVSAYDQTAAYWGTTHEKAWQEVKKRPFLAGLFVWTGFDYLGEPVPYPYPARSSYFGIIDLAGFPKDVYYLYQSEWTDKPVLHLFPHWNWKKGDVVDVWAYYSQADEVELFLNQQSLGIRKKGKDLHVAWKVDYQPGILKAVSRKNGVTVLTDSVQTAGAAAKIVLQADRSVISADGKDLSFVTVNITDKNGILVPDAGQLIRFSVTGSGQIAGTDNGYQASLESFRSPERRAFKGKCIVLLRAAEQPGDVYLKASAAGLADALIRIRVVPVNRNSP